MAETLELTATYPDLRGKVVFVTGGSRGIGARTARAFAAQGALVCAAGRDREALAAVGADTAMTVTADVTDGAALEEARLRVEAELGPVDVLCAFAGGQGFPVPSAELTGERWREVIESDLTSAFLTVRTFLPGMLDRRRGAIVTMSSTSGRQPSLANLAYGAANAGLVMMTRHLAAEVGPGGVRINCIAPSSILTEKVAAGMPEDVREKVAAMHPLRRLGTPEDVAAAALFLASDAASWLTGITVDVSGGRVTV